MINLILLFASLVLVFAAGVLLKPIPAAAGEMPALPLDRHVAFRVTVVAVVISCSLAAGLMAAYSANPETFRWAIARPLDRSLDRYYWGMLAGAGLYVIVRLCGAESRWSLWVLCLSLPGAVTFPVTLVVAPWAGVDRLDEVVVEFLIHPATLILPFIAVRQLIVLRKSGDIRPLFGVALTLFVAAVYLSVTPLRLPSLG